MSKEFEKKNGIDFKVEPKNISEQAGLERLRKLRYQATSIQKSWVDKFGNGETRKYRFVYDERTGYKPKHYQKDPNDETKWLDEGVMKFHFYVLNLDDPDQLKYGPDQEFTLAKTHAVPILDQLLKEHFDLEITRHGLTNRDTRYEVKPIVTTTAV